MFLCDFPLIFPFNQVHMDVNALAYQKELMTKAVVRDYAVIEDMSQRSFLANGNVSVSSFGIT